METRLEFDGNSIKEGVIKEWYSSSIGNARMSVKVVHEHGKYYVIIESTESALEYLTRAKRLKALSEIRSCVEDIAKLVDKEIELTYYGDF